MWSRERIAILRPAGGHHVYMGPSGKRQVQEKLVTVRKLTTPTSILQHHPGTIYFLAFSPPEPGQCLLVVHRYFAGDDNHKVSLKFSQNHGTLKNVSYLKSLKKMVNQIFSDVLGNIKKLLCQDRKACWGCGSSHFCSH